MMTTTTTTKRAIEIEKIKVKQKSIKGKYTKTITTFNKKYENKVISNLINWPVFLKKSCILSRLIVKLLVDNLQQFVSFHLNSFIDRQFQSYIRWILLSLEYHMDLLLNVMC